MTDSRSSGRPAAEMVSKVALQRLAEEAVAQQIAERGIVTVGEWGEWKNGEHCGISREEGHFKFISVRVDPEGNPLHVNVYGGVKGEGAWRSFDVDRLQTKAAKQNRLGRWVS